MSKGAAADGVNGAGDGGASEDLGYPDLGDDDDGLADAFEDALEASDADEEEFERPAEGRGRKRAKGGRRDKVDAAADDAEDDDADDEDGDDDRDDDADEDDEDDDREADDDGEEGEDDRDADDEDVIEHEGQNYRVSDLLESHKAFNEVRGQIDQIKAKVEADGRAALKERTDAADAKVKEMGDLLELVSALVPNLDAITPSTTMLDERHDDYNPDGYHFLKAQKEQVEDVLSKAREAVKAKADERKSDADKRAGDYIQREAQALLKVSPHLAKAEAQEKLRAELKQHFKMDDELMDRLVDHRLFVIAEAALKFAKAQAKGAPKPKGRKAPRHVRGRRGAAPSKGNRSREQAAADKLRRTGRVDDNDLEDTFGRFI